MDFLSGFMGGGGAPSLSLGMSDETSVSTSNDQQFGSAARPSFGTKEILIGAVSLLMLALIVKKVK